MSFARDKARLICCVYGCFFMEEQVVFEDDKLAVAVKSDTAAKIRDAYRAFGWRLENQYDDVRFGDIVHMDFARPHKIEGKDRLQLLQVRFEVALNFLGRASRLIVARAVVIGILLGIIALALTVYGGVVVAYSTTSIFIASGFALISAGIIFFVLAVVTAGKVHSTDKQRYGAVSSVLRENIAALLSEARSISLKEVAEEAEDAH